MGIDTLIGILTSAQLKTYFLPGVFLLHHSYDLRCLQSEEVMWVHHGVARKKMITVITVSIGWICGISHCCVSVLYAVTHSRGRWGCYEENATVCAEEYFCYAMLCLHLERKIDPLLNICSTAMLHMHKQSERDWSLTHTLSRVVTFQPTSTRSCSLTIKMNSF